MNWNGLYIFFCTMRVLDGAELIVFANGTKLSHMKILSLVSSQIKIALSGPGFVFYFSDLTVLVPHNTCPVQALMPNIVLDICTRNEGGEPIKMEGMLKQTIKCFDTNEVIPLW